MINFIEVTVKSGRTAKALEAWLASDTGLFVSNEVTDFFGGINPIFATKLGMSDLEFQHAKASRKMAYLSSFEDIEMIVDQVLVNYKFNTIVLDLIGCYGWNNQSDIVRLEEFCKSRGITTIIATKQIPLPRKLDNRKMNELADIVSELSILVENNDNADELFLNKLEDSIIKLKLCWADLKLGSNFVQRRVK